MRKGPEGERERERERERKRERESAGRAETGGQQRRLVVNRAVLS